MRRPRFAGFVFGATHRLRREHLIERGAAAAAAFNGSGSSSSSRRLALETTPLSSFTDLLRSARGEKRRQSAQDRFAVSAGTRLAAVYVVRNSCARKLIPPSSDEKLAALLQDRKWNTTHRIETHVSRDNR